MPFYTHAIYSARQNLKTPKKKIFPMQNQTKYNSKITIRI